MVALPIEQLFCPSRYALAWSHLPRNYMTLTWPFVVSIRAIDTPLILNNLLLADLWSFVESEILNMNERNFQGRVYFIMGGSGTDSYTESECIRAECLLPCPAVNFRKSATCSETWKQRRIKDNFLAAMAFGESSFHQCAFESYILFIWEDL